MISNVTEWLLTGYDCRCGEVYTRAPYKITTAYLVLDSVWGGKYGHLPPAMLAEPYNRGLFDDCINAFMRWVGETSDVMRSKYLRQMATECTHYLLGSFANRSPDHDRLLNSTKEQIEKKLQEIMEREAHA